MKRVMFAALLLLVWATGSVAACDLPEGCAPPTGEVFPLPITTTRPMVERTPEPEPTPRITLPPTDTDG